MENKSKVLDNVYQTFTNLDALYDEGKRTRTEFIKQKLGGDIGIGITVILDYLSSQDYTSVDDIEKLSRVKEVFQQIRANIDRLDDIPDFESMAGENLTTVKELLLAAEKQSGNVVCLTQKELYSSTKAFHIRANLHETLYTPIEKCSAFFVYDRNIKAAIEKLYDVKGSIEIGDFAVVKGQTVKSVSRQTAVKYIK